MITMIDLICPHCGIYFQRVLCEYNVSKKRCELKGYEYKAVCSSKICRGKQRSANSISKKDVPDGFRRCTKCLEIKIESNFSKGSNRSYCKPCKLINDQESRILNPISEKTKEHRSHCFKKWSDKKENKERINSNRRIYNKIRLKNDPRFKLRARVSGSIKKFLKSKSLDKVGSIINYLDYSIEELKEHLESLFEPWMTWENWGVYNRKSWNDEDSSTWVWHLDHIIPHYTFNYISMEDEEFKKCWALSNLRPYAAKQNVIDGAKKSR